MTTKIPFIESYLFEYQNNDDEIKNILNENILNENKCKIINYDEINSCTKFEEYDFIIIVGKNTLKKLINNKLELYTKYKNKLFFIGDYSEYCQKQDKLGNILTKIKCGLNISIYLKYKKNILLTNLMQNICINDIKKYSSDTYIYNANACRYLPSSIKQINIKFKEYEDDIILKNIPNKVKLIYLNISSLWDRKLRKIPKKAIIVCDNFKLYDKQYSRLINTNYIFDKEEYKEILMKIKMTKCYITVCGISDYNINKKYGVLKKIESGDTLIEKIIIKKENKKLKLVKKIYNYRSVCEPQCNNYIEKCKIEKNYNENSWKILLDDFVEKYTYNDEDNSEYYYQTSNLKNINIITKKQSKINEFLDLSNNYIEQNIGFVY